MTNEKIIKHADEIVSFMKKTSREVSSFRLGDDVDFIGCSLPYVEEKIRILEHDLKWIKKRCREINKIKNLQAVDLGGEGK